MMISKGIFSFGLCCCCCCCCCIKIVYMYLVRCARVLALEQICEKLYVCIWNADMNMRSNARNIYIIDWQKKNTALNNWESPNKGRKHSGERARTVWSDFGCARILFFSLQFNPIESWAHCGSFSLSLWVCMRFILELVVVADVVVAVTVAVVARTLWITYTWSCARKMSHTFTKHAKHEMLCLA